MSSPHSTTSADQATDKTQEQITFRFCSECSNMLYPKEDADAHKLQFTCRTCQYTEEAQSTCVFRNFMNTSAGETAGVTQDVGSDPTVRSAQPNQPDEMMMMMHGAAAPDLCTGCGSVIACDTCGMGGCEMVARLVTAAEQRAGEEERAWEKPGWTPWEDPFDEYDEEMEETDEESVARSDDSVVAER